MIPTPLLEQALKLDAEVRELTVHTVLPSPFVLSAFLALETSAKRLARRLGETALKHPEAQPEALKAAQTPCSPCAWSMTAFRTSSYLRGARAPPGPSQPLPRGGAAVCGGRRPTPSQPAGSARNSGPDTRSVKTYKAHLVGWNTPSHTPPEVHRLERHVITPFERRVQY